MSYFNRDLKKKIKSKISSLVKEISSSETILDSRIIVITSGKGGVGENNCYS